MKKKVKAEFDLEERTALFGVKVIEMLKGVPVTPKTSRIIEQLTGSATSVGANYCEANDAVSKREFRKFIGICRRESGESKYFLRMMAAAYEPIIPAARPLWSEAKQLNLIFSKIFRTTTAALKSDEE